MKEESPQSTSQTKRAMSLELEAVLGDPIKVLDHGFIRVVDYMGNDSAIVQAARVSYGTGTKQVSQDRGLILYLMRHRHTTPFEMCEIKFHVKLPIFVARQWIRHRTANVNEYSARYSIAPREFYLPNKEQIAVQATHNKQGRGEVLNAIDAERVLSILRDDSQRCYDHYEELINEDFQGNTLDASKPKLARELARMNLTLNCYTEWYWKIDLHNLLHFLKLRADQHAQYEIRVYADVMMDLVKRWAPIALEAFEEYCMHGRYVSRKAIAALQKMLAGHKVSQPDSGLSKREWEELIDTFELST